VDAEAPKAEPARHVGEEAIRFSHSGERFILGYGEDFFGIWDRNVPGGPVARFPRHDEGWTQAWNQYTTWEARFVEVLPDGTVARPGGEGEARPTGGLARAVVVLLGLTAALAVLTAATRVGLIARLDDFRQGRGAAATVQDASNVVDGFAITTFVLVLITAVVWITWQHRAHAALPALSVVGRRFTPGWVVAWWLIPVANFVMPLLTVAELWKATDPEAGPADWAARPIPALLGLWWACCLLRFPVLGAVASGIGTGQDLDALTARAGVGIASDLVMAVAAVLAIVLVRRIEERRRRKALTAAASGAQAA
jgi:hypothetical protein